MCFDNKALGSINICVSIYFRPERNALPTESLALGAIVEKVQLEIKMAATIKKLISLSLATIFLPIVRNRNSVNGAVGNVVLGPFVMWWQIGSSCSSGLKPQRNEMFTFSQGSEAEETAT